MCYTIYKRQEAVEEDREIRVQKGRRKGLKILQKQARKNQNKKIQQLHLLRFNTSINIYICENSYFLYKSLFIYFTLLYLFYLTDASTKSQAWRQNHGTSANRVPFWKGYKFSLNYKT